MSHDPIEIILICWSGAEETFLITINVEDGCAAFFYIYKTNNFSEVFDK